MYINPRDLRRAWIYDPSAALENNPRDLQRESPVEPAAGLENNPLELLILA